MGKYNQFMADTMHITLKSAIEEPSPLEPEDTIGSILTIATS